MNRVSSPPELRPQELLIETDRLWLRSMRADDFDALLPIFRDPKVMAAFDSPPFSRQQMQAWLQRNLDHQVEHGFGLCSVLLKADMSLIGNCGLEIMSVEGQNVAELGYDFHSDSWNQGYATEAAMAVRDYAFQQLHLPLLISLIRVGNVASKRVAEKVGMHFAAEFQSGERRYWRYELDAMRSEA
jgi:RimJ/RimL family protein N-acetyltransferase